MSFVADFVSNVVDFNVDFINNITGRTGEKAAIRAANVQQAAAREAQVVQQTAQQEALERQSVAQAEALERSRVAEQQALERSRIATATAREDLQPFTEAGTRAISPLEEGLAGVSRLVTDPEAQREFITDNVFFDALVERSTEAIFSNQAARGKIGSGGTAEALQNSLVLLGSDLLNQNVNQRLNVNQQFQNLVNLGQLSASQQANFSLQGAGLDVGTINQAGALDVGTINQGGALDVNTIRGTANQVSDFGLQGASAQSAGIIGAANALTAGSQNLLNTGVAIAGLPVFNPVPPTVS